MVKLSGFPISPHKSRISAFTRGDKRGLNAGKSKQV